MPDVGSAPKRLVVLFDGESLTDHDVWLPTDTDLTQWVAAALTYSIPVALKECSSPDDVTVEVSVSGITTNQMRELNAQYRDSDRSTNVLSFPSGMPILPAEDGSVGEMLALGDIVVCPDVLADEAQEQGKSLEHHWAHMVVHSVLHLNGLDHGNENAAQTMELLEIQILSSIGIANPYLAASAKQS